MKNTFALAVLLVSAQFIFAQNWTVGVPVNEVVAPSGMGYGALGGCYPNPDVIWNLTIPTVDGIQFSLICTSVDTDAAALNNTNDTLHIGDAFTLTSGANLFSLFYFSPNQATNPVLFDIVAIGTPETAGQLHPCNVNEVLYTSNLGICPDQLTGNLPLSCNVQEGNNIPLLSVESLQFISPSPKNDFKLLLKNASRLSSLTIYNSEGSIIYSTSSPIRSEFDFNANSSGIYLITGITTDGQKLNSRFCLCK